MDLVTLAVAQKYTRDKIAEAAVGGVDVTELVTEKVAEVVGTATESFNTLGEMETAIKNKVDKVDGKGLSTNDFTDAEKTKLASALTSYTETDPTVPAWAKAASKPKYTASEVGALPNTTTIPTTLAGLAEDATHRVVTDAEKTSWNAKSNFSGSYNDLTNKPTIPSTAGLASETYVNNAVAGKVDASTLATVATSGSYNDLNDKPTIPSIAGLATEEYVNNAVANIVLISEGGKRFKLTVDDAGALTATEITE